MPQTQTPLSHQATDHQTLGLQQHLFTTSIYSPGTPIFLPHGTRIFNRLVAYLRDLYVRYGFQEVITPTISKKALWERSGHLDNYASAMFTVTAGVDRASRGNPTADPTAAAGGKEEVDDEASYSLKPMNCPAHCLIFATQQHSYRELPIRYADFSPLHRNEVTGALSGLTRVRRFHQDDGHIFCRPAQVEDEIRLTLDFVRTVYARLGLGPYRLALSTRPLGRFMGSVDEWDRAEAALRRALTAAFGARDEESSSSSSSSSGGWAVNEGDGAFYGPKIDIILQDRHGKEHQTATVQLDFQLPKRFDLVYDAPAPAFEARGEVCTDRAELESTGNVRPVMIHRAVLGSVERLMALLIEHYAGRWPFWLNPRQAVILTVNDTEPVVRWAREVQAILTGLRRSHEREVSSPLASQDKDKTDGATGRTLGGRPSGLAVDLDTRAESLPRKKRAAIMEGYGAIIVVGPRNVESRTVSVDLYGLPEWTYDEKGQVCVEHHEVNPQELLARMKFAADPFS